MTPRSSLNSAYSVSLLAATLFVALAICCNWSGSRLSPAEILYNKGDYAEALPLLRDQAATTRSGALLYQLGYCTYAVEGSDEERRALWREAVQLLQEELAAPEGATLDRLYYLAAIHLNEGDHEAMRRFSRRAVDEIETGPEMTSLDGEDWFRLARMHDWLNEPSEAEAAYRRAVSAFRAEKLTDNPTYWTLALARVADIDFTNLRYQSSADNYDEAFALLPGSEAIHPFQHGLALLAVDRFSDAIDRFKVDRDPDTMEDSRVAAEIARMAEEASPLIEEDFDGMKLGKMPMGTLRNRILESGGAFLQVRNRYSYKRGDPLVPEVVDRQKRFISLVREMLIRTHGIQGFLYREGLAELVRP